MSENNLPEFLAWLDVKEAEEKEIFFIYEKLYKKLDGVGDFAKRLAYVTDAIEELFCLVNNEKFSVSRIGGNKNVKKIKRWKKSKLR